LFGIDNQLVAFCLLAVDNLKKLSGF